LILQIGQNGINDDELHGAFHFLLQILYERNILIYEEAIMELVYLSLKLCSQFIFKESDKMIRIIRDIVSLESPDVIKAVLILLDDLFDFLGQNLHLYFVEFFEIEGKLLYLHENIAKSSLSTQKMNMVTIGYHRNQ